jgi:imidazolonepropionase-like amidohydrolase
MLEGSAQIGADEVRVGAAYEAARAGERHRVGALKQLRRVRLGEAVALVFENRDTIRSTLEEALRTERVDDPGRIAAEIAAFNAVVPEPGALAAVLFIEVSDPADLAAAAARLEGIEHAVYLEVGGIRVAAVPDAVSPPGESVPAHSLRFRLEPDQRAAVSAGAAIAIGTDHRELRVRVPLDEDQRAAIAADL